jgi:hypothetical protein
MSTENLNPEDYIDSVEESMKELKDDKVEEMLKDDGESMETEEQGKEPSTTKAPLVSVPAPVPPPLPPLNSGSVRGAASGSGSTAAATSAAATASGLHSHPLDTGSTTTSTSTGTGERRNSDGSSTGTGASLPRIYHNIRAARQSQQAVRILNGCAAGPEMQVGSFLENDTAEQISTANYRHTYSKKQNISTSFNLDTLVCNTCTGNEHQVLRREKDRIDAKDLVPMAFILSDQNFPALLPAEGDGECLKILRIELHGVPVPGSGINGTPCIRALLEVTQWLASVPSTHGRDITTFREKFTQDFVVENDAGSQYASASGGGSSLTPPTGTGSTMSSAPLRFTLPTNLNSKTYGVFESNFIKIPKKIEPMNNDTINIIACMLIDELNSKFMTELAYPLEGGTGNDTGNSWVSCDEATAVRVNNFTKGGRRPSRGYRGHGGRGGGRARASRGGGTFRAEKKSFYRPY